MGVVSQRLRDSARGGPCMFTINHVCNHDPATTVLCHSPSDGDRGMSSKNHDFLSVFGCSDCHRFMDLHGTDEIHLERYWLRALKRQWKWWVENGFIKIVGDDEGAKPRAKKLSKVVPHDGRMRR